MNCTIAGCDRVHHGRGWCQLHYQRWQRTGDPLVASTGYHLHRRGKSLPFEPLWALVRPEDQREFATRVGVTRRTITRWKAQGIPLCHADAVAVKLAMHPQSIWPGCDA